MSLLKTILPAALLAASLACSAGSEQSAPTTQGTLADSSGVGGSSSAPNAQAGAAEQPAAPADAEAGSGTAGRLTADERVTTMVSDKAAPVAVERKIIRNATLTVETDDPAEGQRKVVSAAEQHGGYVVVTQSTQSARGGGQKPGSVVTVELRVPAERFGAVLDAIRGVGGRVVDEKITGQDVTEEYIDLEARVRTQKALEAQIMEIMKRADRVSDALEVQAQLATVRTEIERLEGRRRFLENQSSLSTIKVTLQPPSPFVESSTTGFMAELKDAFGDGIDFGASLLLGLIRVVLALTPVVLFVFLPLGLLVRYLVRRYWRRRLAGRLSHEAPAETR